MAGQFDAVKLLQEYDPTELLKDLRNLEENEFASQRGFDTGQTSGGGHKDWRVLPLRSPGGSAERTDPGGPGLVDFGETRFAGKTPYLASILAAIPTQIRAARLMSLAPGASVDEHRDAPYGLGIGWVRLHIPIVTNEGAALVINGVDHQWQPGTLWYGDFSQPHYVRNTGDAARVHLVFDCHVNRALLDLFPDEFRTQLAWPDVLLDRDEVPLSGTDLHDLQGTFTTSKAFPWGDLEDLTGEQDFTQQAELVATGEDLVLHVEGAPQCKLVHLGEGEFRMSGWTAERTIKIETARHQPVRARLRIRDGSRLEEILRPLTPSH